MWPLTLLVGGRPVLLVIGRNDPFKPAVDLDELRATGVPGWDGDPAGSQHAHRPTGRCFG